MLNVPSILFQLHGVTRACRHLAPIEQARRFPTTRACWHRGGCGECLVGKGTSHVEHPHPPTPKTRFGAPRQDHLRPVAVPHYASLASHYEQRRILWFARRRIDRQASGVTLLVAAG